MFAVLYYTDINKLNLREDLKMLEIPESHTIAEQLKQTILGKVISSVNAAASPHGFAFYSGDPQMYPLLLCGKAIVDSKAYGGLIEVAIEDVRLLFGDGVVIKYIEAGCPVPKKHQLHIELDDSSSIVCTVQMYGGLWAYKEGEDDTFYHSVAKEKPSPLTVEFDRVYFEDLFSGCKQNMSLKAFLATEQRIPGLGNGVLQDILFNARLNPKTKLETLSDEDKDRLFDCVKQTIRNMTEKGGRDTEKNIFGNTGGYTTILSKKTLQDPCPVCGGTIIRKAYLGGNVYYCPVCQPV